jgi:HEAT repeat protein
LAVFLYNRAPEINQNVSALTSDTPEVRAKALLWLAEANPQDAHRAQVTASLEPLVLEGDARGNLDPDLLLRAYLRWAGPDNVPSLIRMVDAPNLPCWCARKSGLVMQTLGKLQDDRAADVLARKLIDPQLHEQAVSALKLLGPGATRAVLDNLFVEDPAVRQRAGDLLADYGTRPTKVLGAALGRLTSNDPYERRIAAGWFADNPPASEADKAPVAGALVKLLDDLSPQTNGLALRALKLWVTRDCLAQLVDFGRRLEKAGATNEIAANKSALIDVLAQFPNAPAAETIAGQLKDPGQRDKAVQALLKLSPVAGPAVLPYLNHPDAGLRKEAESLCRLLNVPGDRQLEQTLADLGDVRKARCRTALHRLAQLRPDGASRDKVSQALNAPLLDPDPAIRDGALEALAVWATPANTAALVPLLGGLQGDTSGCDARTCQRVAQALVAIGPSAESAVASLLKSPDGLVRRQACWILAAIGTDFSVRSLQFAGEANVGVDPDFVRQAQAAVARLQARQ